MAVLEAEMVSGSLLRYRQMQWAPIYEDVLDILGSTGTIMSLGDPADGQPNATTFVTRGEEQVAFTWSEAPASFDTPLDLTSPDSYQGIIPVIDFNGTDEEADTPDNTYFEGGDGTNDNAISLGWWVKPTNTGEGSEGIWTNATGSGGGLRIGLNRWLMRDPSVAKQCRRDRNSGISANEWNYLVWTYSGVGGSSAANGVSAYLNGAPSASSATNQSGYVAMEAHIAVTTIAHSPVSVNFYDGKMAGGPLGPFFTQTVLSADAVRQLYLATRGALAA